MGKKGFIKITEEDALKLLGERLPPSGKDRFL